jgi:hypothetical protein
MRPSIKFANGWLGGQNDLIDKNKELDRILFEYTLLALSVSDLGNQASKPEHPRISGTKFDYGTSQIKN